MRKIASILCFAAVLCGLSYAQTADIKTDPSGIVTISARGTDVSPLLNDLFAQAKKNFVIEPGVRMVVYLSLTGVDFEEALQIICKNANLKFDIQNGIYYVSKLDAAVASVDPKPEVPPQPKGKLPTSIFAVKITTRFSKTDLGVVLASMAKQAGIKIEIDPAVPHYKLDAFLIGTSLKSALDILTKSTGLEYKLTDNLSIMVSKPDPNKVMVVKNGS